MTYNFTLEPKTTQTKRRPARRGAPRTRDPTSSGRRNGHGENDTFLLRTGPFEGERRIGLLVVSDVALGRLRTQPSSDAAGTGEVRREVRLRTRPSSDAAGQERFDERSYPR